MRMIARSRMYYLFERAHEIFPENPYLANRYVYLARKYAQKVKINIPKEWKQRICHKCKQFLYSGINIRVRMQSRPGKGSHLSITCLECGNITRKFIKTTEN